MKKRRFVVLTVLCAVLSLGMLACHKKQTVEPTAFELISRDITVVAGENAEVAVKSNKKDAITYASFDTTVATVSETGTVTGVSEGRTFVQVTLGDEQAVCKVTVVNKKDAVLLDCGKVDLVVGSVREITATVIRDGKAYDGEIAWSVTDSENCGFVHSGNQASFSATRVGKFTVSASCGNISASCEIRVVSVNATRLGAVSGLSVTCGGAISWDAVENASGYAVSVNGGKASVTDATTLDLSEVARTLKNGETLGVSVYASAGDNYDYIDGAAASASALHAYTAERQGDVSCKAYGNIQYTCGVCSGTYTDENVLAEHTWDGAACSVCGKSGFPLMFKRGYIAWNPLLGITEYSVWLDGVKIGTTAGTSFDIIDCIDISREEVYSIDVRPVGNQSSYIPTQISVVHLNNSNFAEKLNAADSRLTYYVLNGDITLNHTYATETLHDADGGCPDDQLCSSPIKGIKNAVLDGNGHEIMVDFDGTPKPDQASWEVMGGIFGYAENALIRNLRTDITMRQKGFMHPLFSSGALVAVLKGNTFIENCYIKSRAYFNDLSYYNSNGGGYGAVAGFMRAGNELSEITNCVIDSSMYENGIKKTAPADIVGKLETDVLVDNNAYIVNHKLPAEDGMFDSYKETFLSWRLPSQNWMFSTLSDLFFGDKGTLVKYENWKFDWTFNLKPRAYCGVSKLYESKEWQGTSFVYNADSGLTLCGKPLIAPQTLTPTVLHGILRWEGVADGYEVYSGETKLGDVTDKSFDLAKAVNYAEGTHSITVAPKGFNEYISYAAVAFKVKFLTQSNFVDELKNSAENMYYILTEDVKFSYMPTGYEYANERPGYTEIGAVTDGENKTISLIPSFAGVLDGRGYRIEIAYAGKNEFVGGLFGAVEDAYIKNINYSAEFATYGGATGSGGLARTLGANTVVENCYFKEHLEAGSPMNKNFGALARTAAAGTTVRNCVFDVTANDPQQSNARVWMERAIIGNVNANIDIVDNAFILNMSELPTITCEDNNGWKATDGNGNNYQELFSVWGKTSDNNYAYASLADFVNGANANKCAYASWKSTWTNNLSAGKIYEQWENSSFAYDSTNGLMLCGKPITADA